MYGTRTPDATGSKRRAAERPQFLPRRTVRQRIEFVETGREGFVELPKPDRPQPEPQPESRNRLQPNRESDLPDEEGGVWDSDPESIHSDPVVDSIDPSNESIHSTIHSTTMPTSIHSTTMPSIHSTTMPSTIHSINSTNSSNTSNQSDAILSAPSPIRSASDPSSADPNSIALAIRTNTLSLTRTAPTVFDASRDTLIRYLRTRGWPAHTLQEFLAAHAEPREYAVRMHELDKLATLLQVYVVSPFAPVTRVSNDRLIDLWASAPGTSYAAELDTGFWEILSRFVGPGLVAFLLTKCRVYRPLTDGELASSLTTAPVRWLDLTLGRRWHLYFDWETMRRKMHIPRAAEKPKFGTVCKRDIMYRHGAALEPPELPAVQTGLPRDLLAIVAHRLKQRAALSHRAQTPEVLLKSRQNRQNQQSRPDWTPVSTVGNFVSAVLRSLLPTRLLGSKGNHRAFYRAVTRYLKKPARAPATFASFAKDIKLNEVPWLAGRSGKPEVFVSMLQWLISHVVHPVLAHHFYITEMSGRPTTIYYFEHFIWRTKYEQKGRAILAERAGAEVDENQGDTLPEPASETPSIEDQAVRTRFVPKPNGTVRAIANLKELNQSLRTAHEVLHQLTVHTYSRRPHDWLAELYAFRQQFSATSQFYAVKADLHACYDNANVDTVLRLVAALVAKPRVYRVGRFRGFDLARDQIRDQTFVRALPEIVADELLKEAAAAPKSAAGNGAEIVGEFAGTEFTTNDAVLRLARRLLTELRLRTGRQDAVRTTGIPQGSCISLELCNILLEELVRTELAEFADRGLLLRYVDDFLFVTPDRQTAVRFLVRLEAGFRETYGQFCLPEKIVTNLTGPASTKYLGHKLSLDTLELVPDDMPLFRMPLNASIDKLGAMRKQLHLDVLRLTEPIRTFVRCELPVPPELLHKTLVKFGCALAQRMPYYLRLAKRRRRTSTKQVMYSLIHRYFGSLVPPPEHGSRLYRPVVKRYCQAGPAVPLSWRRITS